MRISQFVERLHTMVKDDSSLGWKALALFDVGMTFVYVILQLIRTTPQLSDKDHEVFLPKLTTPPLSSGFI